MTTESSTSKKFSDAILDVEVIEAILKNLTWFFAAATIMRVVPLAISLREYLFVVLAFCAFIGIVFLNLAYGVKKILLPIDIAMGAHLSIVKDLNKLPGQSDAKRLKRTFSFLFCTKGGWSYLIVSFMFMWFVLTALQLLSIPTPHS
ncbi:hypothetical protein [Dechloromonas sp. CZR5]|uniref:hypothetical protein n=1 Tax=Dechloromonas sp. CZR5 TaxID=2608630 RepID=UPI00123DB48B|nr:hypothetical protein [Dechloromonas sp. CZR5]